MPSTWPGYLAVGGRTSPVSTFWARGYYVSTVGQDEQAVRQFIEEQEATDRQWDQLQLDE